MSAKPHAPSAKALPEKEQTLHTLFSRLKIIRNLSLGVSTLGTGLMVGAIKKPLGAPTIVAAATLTALALTSAATAQVLLSLNEQLESMLNQPNGQ